jgi:hypothetical protein
MENRKEICEELVPGWKDQACVLPHCNNTFAECVCENCGAHVCMTCFMGHICDGYCPICNQQTMY